MNKFTWLLVVLLLAASCSPKKKIPDVSGIKVSLNIERFDQDFFAIDTSHLTRSLDRLQEKYPVFLNDFLYNIMAMPPQEDSLKAALKLFYHDYKKVYDSAQLKFPNFSPISKQIERGFRFVKYYFPDYKLPQNVILFIGPIEGYGNVLTSSGLAVGLQLYLGKNFPAYQTDYIQSVYPPYQSARFEPAYIPVNCLRNILEDIYPGRGNGKPLIEQMIEEGKRMYLLDAFLPDTPDTLKTGYTGKQLDGCYKNEALIWNYFVENNLLFITDPMQTRDYVSDGPKTEALGDASPGNIGRFVGWQIVKKWMGMDAKRTLTDLINTPAKTIFEEAAYKPR